MKASKHVLLALSVALSGVIAGSASAQSVPVGGPLLEENVTGSFLVFPKFDIRGDTATQLRIVNNGPDLIAAHLNFVCPGVKNVNDFCASLDRVVTLTPHQTRVIDVADQNPPCNQGFVIAYAQVPTVIPALPNSGQPVSYNWLSGSYHIGEGRRLEAETAIAVQSTQSIGSVLGSAGKLRFGGGDYSAMPTNLFTDFRSVFFGNEAAADEGSRITLLTLDTLAGMQNPPAVAFVDFWNAAEEPFSSSVEFICWTERQLDTIDANFLEENLGSTHGSMKLTPFPNCPLPGGCPPLVPFDATMLGQIEEYGDGVLSARLLSHDQTPKATAYQPR